MKITESKLRQIVKESVKKTLKEGMTSDNPCYEKWYYLVNTFDPELLLDAIFDYLDATQLEKMVGWFEQDGYFEGTEWDELQNNEEY